MTASSAGHCLSSDFVGLRKASAFLCGKWPSRTKLPHIHRQLIMVTLPKGGGVVGHNALGMLGDLLQGQTPTLSAWPLQWELANTRQQVRVSPRALLSGGDAVLIPTAAPVWLLAAAHQRCLYRALPCCDHQTQSGSQ